MGKIDERLAALGIEVPTGGAPPGSNYVPTAEVNGLVFVSGQVTRKAGRIEYVGKAGADYEVATAQKAARLCAENIIGQMKIACGGDLDRVARIVRVTGYVNCTPDFKEQPQVVNGASDLFVEVFGEAGRHARTAIGVAALPGGAVCEIEAIFQMRALTSHGS
jgi:enamine deaminase RidA (YjgF/YER057c/UK114 family)